MILPLPDLSKDWQKTPVTWTLLALNIFLFILFFSKDPSSERESAFLRPKSLQVTGQLYFQYLKNLSPQELFTRPSWIHRMKTEDSEQMETLGVYALRDEKFLDYASEAIFHGDMVRIVQWRKDLQEFRRHWGDDLAFAFGLSSPEPSLKWITYQFTHAGWMHLFSNMIFMLVVSLAIERIAGGVVLIAIYLLGGIAGGWAFLLMQATGVLAPMVGASASVSALMAYYCIIETRRSIRYGFFLTPLQGQHGFIFLPVLLMVPLFLVSDFASLLSSPAGLGGGVAYAAHIGGSLLGLVAGSMSRLWLSQKA